MAKFTVKNNYGVAPNELLNDKNLSFKAKGLWTYLQSKPDNWDFSAERIAKEGCEGVDSVSSGLKELEQNGYLTRKKYQDERGHWCIEYILSIKEKISENPNSEIPNLENPSQEIPSSENTLNISKKDSSKKYNSNKEVSKAKKENPNLIIPEMLSAWIEVFPNYAGYQVNDFPALKEILDFMIEQKDVGHDIENSENIEKAKSKMRTIAMNVKADKFYNGKSLDTIRKKVQEFYLSKHISESKSIKNSFDLEVQKILEREKIKNARVS